MHIMPVKIGSFEAFSEEGFKALRQQKRGTSNSAMVELLNEVEVGRAIRVSPVDGQSARGLRVAISRAATSRGLDVETVEGDGSSRCGKSTSKDRANLHKLRLVRGRGASVP